MSIYMEHGTRIWITQGWFQQAYQNDVRHRHPV